MNWLFESDLQMGRIKSPFDISDVWTSSYSTNTNEIIVGSEGGSALPVDHLRGAPFQLRVRMDQPTYTSTQKMVEATEATGTLFFKFGDLDSTKPAGGIKIRIETIVHYLAKYSQKISCSKN